MRPRRAVWCMAACGALLLALALCIVSSGVWTPAATPTALPTQLPASQSAGSATPTVSGQTTADAAAIPAPTPERANGQLLSATIPAPSLEDNLLGDPATNSLLIYLPPGYETSDKRYPVVYFLPGFSTDNTAFTRGTFQGLRLQDSLDQLIAQGAIEEMIVAIPKGQHGVGGSFYVNSPVTGNWEDLIVRDVVGYVDAHYRTLAQAPSRGIAGHSMGGYGALHLAMLHPDIFGATYACSPGLFDPEGLADSQMFASQRTIDQFLALESRLASMPREQAHAEFLSAVQALNASDSLRFTIAYGAAFAPEPAKNAPYTDYPCRRPAQGDLTCDEAAWSRWQSGFGALREEVQQHKENLLQLRGIALDYGTSDPYAWITRGCQYFSQALTEAGIPHQIEGYQGGHSDRLRQRIESHVLPFFSECLLSE